MEARLTSIESMLQLLIQQGGVNKGGGASVARDQDQDQDNETVPGQSNEDDDDGYNGGGGDDQDDQGGYEANEDGDDH